MFNNSSDGTVAEKKIKASNIGRDIGTDGSKMEAKPKYLTTAAMEQLEKKKKSVSNTGSDIGTHGGKWRQNQSVGNSGGGIATDN